MVRMIVEPKEYTQGGGREDNRMSLRPRDTRLNVKSTVRVGASIDSVGIRHSPRR